MFYYKNSDEEKMIGSVLLPSYTVTCCSTNSDGITRKFAFKLEHHNLKTHYLAAECAESQNQWMTLISLSATMQLNAINYEQLTDGTISSALTATSISRNRPDSQDMMNMILNGNRTMNNENNKNFVNTNQQDMIDSSVDQFNNTSSNTVNSSMFNGQQQRRDSSNLDNSNHDDLKQLSESCSESGFTNYKSRRQSKTNSELESYNSIGLPTTASNGGTNYSIYSASTHKGPNVTSSSSNLPASSNSQLNKIQQQPIYVPKRSHYVNAPPKPRRHQVSNNVNNLDADFETYTNGNLNAYNATNQQTKARHLISENQPDLVDTNGYQPQRTTADLYSIPPSHCQQRNGSFSNQGVIADQQQEQIDENLYMRRSTLTRQNASDSGHITPMNELVNGQLNNHYYYDHNNLNQVKNRPKSSQEHQFDLANQHFNNMQDQIDQINSPLYRPWSDFLQQAQRSQSTTPMSTKQNRLPAPLTSSVFNPQLPASITNSSTSALAASAAVVALGTQSTSHAQLNNVFTKANRYNDGK